jgi:hypothetical protein
LKPPDSFFFLEKSVLELYVYTKLFFLDIAVID